jgi:outer membrane beta-barrel protein
MIRGSGAIAPSTLLLLSIASVLSGLPASAIAKDIPPDAPEEAPAVKQATTNAGADTRPKVAIQKLKFQMAHEFSFAFGIMPLDAFQKSLTGSFSYTLHFDNHFAWEVFNATAAYLTSTNLRDELINTFAIPAEDFAAPRFMATTGVELTPIYGKLVFLNDSVVHQAVFLGLHGGVIFGARQDIPHTLQDFRPAGGVGIGYRIFFNKTVSFRIDVRDFISFKRAIRANERVETDDVLWISGGFSFNLWRDDA